MKRGVRLAALLLSMLVVLGSTQIYAFNIAEIMGWDTSDEEGIPGFDFDADDDDNNDSDPHNGSSDGRHDDGEDDKNVSSSGSQSDKEKYDAGDEEDAADDLDYEEYDVTEGEDYDTKDAVCAYLVQFHCLPPNYMTKKEAREYGWEGGALSQLIDGMCIGGDYYGNYEGVLPEADGRTYHECDIDTLGAGKRGAERIVYSGDDSEGEWNIYYTDDHYETFTLLWGDDDYE